MNKLSTLTIVSYGSLGLPLAMLGLPLYIYLPTYYTDSVGLSIAMVGILLMVARIVDMIADPLIGILRDSIGDKLGGPKGLILIGSITLLISFYALLHPHESIESFWLFGFSVLAYVGWSMINIPYLTHNVHLTPAYHEKTRLSGGREFFAIIGGVMAVLLPYLWGVSDDPAQSLNLLYIVFVTTLIIALPLVLSTFTFSAIEVPHIKLSLKELWGSINKPLVSAFFINSLANALPATLFLLYVDGCLDAKSSTGLLLLLYFLSGIVALPFWITLSKKIEKRFTWMSSMILASTAFLAIPFLEADDVNIFILICIVSGFSLGADMALPASMQADIAEKTDGASGVLFGIWAMITKLSLALAVGIGFVILGWVGYDSSSPDDTGRLTLSLLYGTLPVILKIAAIVLMRDYRDDESTKIGYE